MSIFNSMKGKKFSKPLTVKIIKRHSGWRALELRELINYRDLFYFLVTRDIKVLYKQTILGAGWAILRPFFSMIVFSIVFGRLAKIPSDGIPYPIFSYVALVPWTYFQTALNTSANSMIASSRIISKVYFPRVFIPLVPVVGGLLDFVIAMSIVALMMIYYNVIPTISLVFLPILITIMMLTAAAAGLWLSILGVQYRDVKFALQFVIQLLMYAAPVVWPASLIPVKYRIVYGLYPMAGVIEGFRSALIGKTPMPWDLVITGLMSAVVLFVTGLYYFRSSEKVLADVA